MFSQPVFSWNFKGDFYVFFLIVLPLNQHFIDKKQSLTLLYFNKVYGYKIIICCRKNNISPITKQSYIKVKEN